MISIKSLEKETSVFFLASFDLLASVFSVSGSSEPPNRQIANV